MEWVLIWIVYFGAPLTGTVDRFKNGEECETARIVLLNNFMADSNRGSVAMRAACVARSL